MGWTPKGSMGYQPTFEILLDFDRYPDRISKNAATFPKPNLKSNSEQLCPHPTRATILPPIRSSPMNPPLKHAPRLLLCFFLLFAVRPPFTSARAAEPTPAEQKIIRATQCLDHLHQIGNALLLYAFDHNGSFPPDLGTLLVDQHLDLSLFVCPAAPSALPAHWKTLAPKEQADWVNAHTDYIYLGAKHGITMKPTEPLVYDKDDDHGNTLAVLFADNRVQLLSLDDAHQQLGPKAGAERTTTRVKPAPGEAPAIPMITLDQAKALHARWAMSALRRALRNFEIDNGRFPTSQEGLNALVHKPAADLPNWRQYLDGTANDPWDHPYHYASPGAAGKEFDLFSAGPDGKPGTADDVKDE